MQGSPLGSQEKEGKEKMPESILSDIVEDLRKAISEGEVQIQSLTTELDEASGHLHQLQQAYNALTGSNGSVPASVAISEEAGAVSVLDSSGSSGEKAPRKARKKRAVNRVDGERKTTVDFVLGALATDPDQPFTIEDIEARMVELGWTTSSTNPINTLRGVLTRLKTSGDIRHVGTGLWQAAS